MKKMIFQTRSFCLLQTLVFVVLSNILMAGEISFDGVQSAQIKTARLSGFADKISRLYRIPVCTEEGRWFDWHDDSSEFLQILESRRCKGIELVITNAPLQGVLDQFVQQQNEYLWRRDTSNGIVNLYPVHNAPADWQVPSISVQTQSIERLLLLSDPFGLRDKGIAFQPDRGEWSWMKENTITLNTQGLALRDVLNRICTQLSENRYWRISEMKPGLTFWDGTKRPVKYSLKFRLYRDYLTPKVPRPK